jgi:hypothetical protein
VERAAEVERQLPHIEGNDVRRAYARGEHWNERVRMMKFWSKYLTDLQRSAKTLKGSDAWQRSFSNG